MIGETQKQELLDKIAKKIATCELCPLHETRTNVVPGSGHPNPDIMLVGEAPGKTEDQEGEPFVGRAGELLFKAAKISGRSRENVFTTNLVKCRPPGNRDPEDEELGMCNRFLDLQIAICNPLVIVPLGRFAAQRMLDRGPVKITELRGSLIRRMMPASSPKTRILIPCLHPAYYLRQGYSADNIPRDLVEVLHKAVSMVKAWEKKKVEQEVEEVFCQEV